jgi:hypothetical protein
VTCDVVTCVLAAAQIDALDIFYKKGAAVPTQKWRPSEIVAVSGEYITVHYLNWDPKYDERLHHLNDSHRLGSFGSRTTRTASSGGSVTSTGGSSTGAGKTHSRQPSASADAPGQSMVEQSRGSTRGDVRILTDASMNEESELDKGLAKRSSPKAASAGASGSVPADSNATPVLKSVDAAADLTPEQSKFTRNFLLYRKKKMAENVSASSPTANSNSLAGAVSEGPPSGRANGGDKESKTSEGGLFKQFTNLFGAKDAGATTLVVTAAPKPEDGTSGEGVPAAAVVVKPLAEGEENERDEEEIARREQEFLEKLEGTGLHVFAIEGDGNCLFRAVSHQLYLHQDMHEELRACCVEHLTRHRKRFEVFCEGDFDEYLRNLSKSGVWGDDLEIRALEEITDRVIMIYSSSAENVLEPINNNFEEKTLLNGVPPLTLSYHGNSHYNSIYDERYPLPLVHRKTRLLLRSRMALNKQDAPTSSGASSGASANGEAQNYRSSEDHSTGYRPGEWHPVSHQQGGGYGGGVGLRQPSVDAAQQHAGGYHYTPGAGGYTQHHHPSAGHYGGEANSAHYGSSHLPAYGEYNGYGTTHGSAYQHQHYQTHGMQPAHYGHPVYPAHSSSSDPDLDSNDHAAAQHYSNVGGHGTLRERLYGGGYYQQQASSVDYGHTHRGY